MTLVWIGIEGDEIVIGHMGEWQKVKNVRRDPRVALSMLGTGKNALGLQEYVVPATERFASCAARWARLIERLATAVEPGTRSSTRREGGRPHALHPPQA